jgi:hypothetical protein
MKLHFRKLAVVVTIAHSFVEAACGSPTGALVFWVTLFSAAVMSDTHWPRRRDYRRLM